MREDKRRRIEITDEMCNKIRKHIEVSGMKDFCTAIGIAAPTVYKYLNGTQTTLLFRTYKKVQDYFDNSNLIDRKEMLTLIKENTHLKQQIETHLDYNNKLLDISSQLNEIAVTLNWITYRKINKEIK